MMDNDKRILSNDTKPLRNYALALVGFVVGILIALALCGCRTLDGLRDRVDIKPPAITIPATPDAPQPEHPAPVTEPVVVPVATDILQWIPDGDSVRVIVPVPHWQLNICTTTPKVNHEVGLWGPSRDRKREYILPGSGESWRERALAIDPKGGGAVVIFTNTNDIQPQHGYRTAHWVIPDPRQPWSGSQGYVKPKQ